MSQVLADDERANGGGPDFDGAVFFEPNNGAVGFDGSTRSKRIVEFAFDDHIRFVKAFFAAAFDKVIGVGDIGAGGLFEGWQTPVVIHIFVDQCSIFSHGITCVCVDGQRFVFHLDFIQGGAGMCGGVCNDSSHRVADITHFGDRHWL
ncbi:MAG: hypothetical protein ACD_34C00225G0003 [uncultured bacterium]|nr:MAG: hypothetical protein ACD_34C00225G0003 [uncultured bacterium]